MCGSRVLRLELDVESEKLDVQFAVDPSSGEHALFRKQMFMATPLPAELCDIIIHYQCADFHEQIRQLFSSMCSLGVTFDMAGYTLDRPRLLNRFFPTKKWIRETDGAGEVAAGGEVGAGLAGRVEAERRAQTIQLPLARCVRGSQEYGSVAPVLYEVYLSQLVRAVSDAKIKNPTPENADDCGYLDLNEHKFEEAVRNFTKFQRVHGRHPNCIGVCFFAGLMLGTKATVALSHTPYSLLKQDVTFST